MEKVLLGKRALVTGSTSGLGREIALSLARAGCSVALSGFGDAGEIEALRGRIESEHGVTCIHEGAELTVPAQVADLVARVSARLGGIDVLVNNAGMQFVSPL